MQHDASVLAAVFLHYMQHLVRRFIILAAGYNRWAGIVFGCDTCGLVP